MSSRLLHALLYPDAIECAGNVPSLLRNASDSEQSLTCGRQTTENAIFSAQFCGRLKTSIVYHVQQFRPLSWINGWRGGVDKTFKKKAILQTMYFQLYK